MKRILLSLCFSFVLTFPASAEILILKSGKIVQGKVVQVTPIYVRIEPKFGDPNREFLVDNIIEIKNDNEMVITEDMLNSGDLPTAEQLPSSIQEAAREMANALIEDAILDLQEDTVPDDMRFVAEEKASEIVTEAMRASKIRSLNDAHPDVRAAAEQMAVALVEETVRTALMPSLNDAPTQVKVAAQEKAAALIEEAMREAQLSGDDSSAQALKIAKEQANVLMQEAIKGVDVLDESPVVPEVLPQVTAPKPMPKTTSGRSRTVVLKEDDRMVIEEIFEDEPMEIVSQETSKKMSPSKSNEIAVPKKIKLPEPHKIPSYADFKPEPTDTVGFLMGLGYKDFLIIGMAVILLLVLLKTRGSRRKTE